MRYPREDVEPWYKQFWPWFVITPPLVGILLGVLLVTAATHDPDGLVVADYTKEGRGINQRIERAQFAQNLGLAADVFIEEERIWIDLRSNINIPRQELALSFLHPTRDHLDLSVSLNYDAARQMYYGDLDPDQLRPALWYVNLEPVDGAWRLRGRFDQFEDREVTLEPSA